MRLTHQMKIMIIKYHTAVLHIFKLKEKVINIFSRSIEIKKLNLSSLQILCFGQEGKLPPRGDLH